MDEPRQPWRKTLIFVRYVLPVLIIVGGLVPIAIEPSGDNLEGGLGVVGAGIAVGLLNVLYRSGVRGDENRRSEDEAREFFDRNGYWPDEDPSAARTGRRAAAGSPPPSPSDRLG